MGLGGGGGGGGLYIQGRFVLEATQHVQLHLHL